MDDEEAFRARTPSHVRVDAIDGARCSVVSNPLPTGLIAKRDRLIRHEPNHPMRRVVASPVLKQMIGGSLGRVYLCHCLRDIASSSSRPHTRQFRSVIQANVRKRRSHCLPSKESDYNRKHRDQTQDQCDSTRDRIPAMAYEKWIGSLSPRIDEAIRG